MKLCKIKKINISFFFLLHGNDMTQKGFAKKKIKNNKSLKDSVSVSHPDLQRCAVYKRKMGWATLLRCV